MLCHCPIKYEIRVYLLIDNFCAHMIVNYGEPFANTFFSQTSRTNPIGMKGHMAKCYGDLVQELWSGTQKNVAPLKLRVSRLKYHENV